jgi:hypothetical protein
VGPVTELIPGCVEAPVVVFAGTGQVGVLLTVTGPEGGPTLVSL